MIELFRAQRHRTGQAVVEEPESPKKVSAKQCAVRLTASGQVNTGELTVDYPLEGRDTDLGQVHVSSIDAADASNRLVPNRWQVQARSQDGVNTTER